VSVCLPDTAIEVGGLSRSTVGGKGNKSTAWIGFRFAGSNWAGGAYYVVAIAYVSHIPYLAYAPICLTYESTLRLGFNHEPSYCMYVRTMRIP
jgi:hypothetical protein